MIRRSDFLARERSAERGAEIAHVESSGGQRKYTPENRHDAEPVVPEHDSDDQESRAADKAKNAARCAVEESRKRRSVEAVTQCTHHEPPE